MRPARSRPRWLPALVALVATALLAGAGCGVPTDDEPRAIPTDAVPSALSEEPGVSTTTTLNEASTQRERIYLVRTASTADNAERLESFPIDLSNPRDAEQVPRLLLERLIATTAEQITMPGLSNAIPSETRVLDATLREDDVLDLNLSAAAADLEGPLQRLAIAQIVFTATGITSLPIKSVIVRIDGEPVAVPVESGTVTAGTPVTRAHYPRFLEQVSASETIPGEG